MALALFQPQYRVRVQSENYTPQVWRWWWPFWVAAHVRGNEGGGSTAMSYLTSRSAWNWIEQQTKREPPAPVSFEYEPPPFRPVPVVPAVDIGPKPAVTISVDDHLTPALARARQAFDTASELGGWTET